MIFEKPLAGSYSDAVRIRELAGRHGITARHPGDDQLPDGVVACEPRAEAPSDGWKCREGLGRLHGVVGNGGPSPRDLRRKVFFDWLTDPETNGAGSLVDFGIYSAIWAVWHLGLPDRVFAATHSLQPKRFPKVEDNAVMVLAYPQAVGLFEGSWNLPRGFQQLEIFGREGSLSMSRDSLLSRAGRKPEVEIKPAPLAPAASHPVRYMIDRVTTGKPLEYIVALDLNVDAVQILEAAKLWAAEHKAVPLPIRLTSGPGAGSAGQ